MSANPLVGRVRCPVCARPQAQCLCSLIPRLWPPTQVLVIQHPDEASHALNTARLLVPGLVNAHLLITENLQEHPAWMRRLQDPQWRNELLFPGERAQVLAPAPADVRPRRLVLLDGTWRKARKLVYLNPVLQTMAQVCLPDGLLSRYRLRKVPQPGALSTIEAGAEALAVLHPGFDKHALLAPFEALIEGQIRAMGQARYLQNYGAGPDRAGE